VGTTRITNSQQLMATIRSQAPGAKIDVTYERAGQSAKVTVTLGSTVDQA
jgi:S1-C subfamily serine protease